MLALALLPLALADEGMWLPEQLPQMSESLAEMGLEIPADQLADLQRAPLGAVISMGGCTASFVSPDGLAITNRHCVNRYLRGISDADNDRMRDGYLAPDRDGEIEVGPAARLWIVTDIRDVSDSVRRGLGPRWVGDAARKQRLDRVSSELVADCEADGDQRCRLVTLYGGGRYQLVSSVELSDVRMVYAPPFSAGEFGGEIDNWEWPRHTADFALFRAYTAAGAPYHPQSWLTIAPSGVEPGDFVAAAGYPGGTERYRRASELVFHAETVYPKELELRDALTDALTAELAASPTASARLAPSIASLENYRKNFQGMLDSFARPGALAPKLGAEAELEAWFDQDPKGTSRCREATDELEVVLAQERLGWEAGWLTGWLLRSADLLSVSYTAWRFAEERQSPDLQREPGYQDRDIERTRDRFEGLDESLWLPADRAMMRIVLEHIDALPQGERVDPIDQWRAGYPDPEAALDALFTAPTLASAQARLALLDMDLDALEASDDPWVSLAGALAPWQAARRRDRDAVIGAKLRLMPDYMQGLQRHAGGTLYPDANSTLRVTVGHVEGYSPRDGVYDTPQTTLAGMLAKVGEPPFDAPESLTSAAERGPESPWADPALGDVPVNFLTTLDTTGGSSGSPVLDASGALVGLAFDGNYESIAADWIFEPALTRTICVDLRYLYWTLEEVEGAGALLSELGAASAPE